MAETFIERVTTRTPKRVTAVRFTGNFDEIEAFVGGDAEFRDGLLVVATRHGALRAKDGDWIVQEEPHRFVAYPPNLFHDAYRAARLSEGTTNG